MARSCWHRDLAWPFAALAVVLGTLRAAPAQDPITHLTTTQIRPSAPLRVSADDVAAWTEGGQRVVLLRGMAFVQQDMTQVHADRAVIWIDEAGYEKKHVYNARCYFEGNVRVENGTERQTLGRAVAELTTRTEVGVRAAQGHKVDRSAHADDRVYRAALDALQPTSSVQQAIAHDQPAAGGIQLAAASIPPTPGATGKVAPTPAPTWPDATPTQGPPTAVPTQGPPAPPGGTALPPGLPALGPPVPPAAAQTTNGPPRNLSIRPRTASAYNAESFTLPSGEKAIVVAGGVILSVRDSEANGLLDIEADRMVLWTKGDGETFFKKAQSSEGQTTQDLEFYLSGNVQIRRATLLEKIYLQAEQVYYDVKRNVAVAVSADLEITTKAVGDPLHLKADELYQTSPTRFETVRSTIYSSKLPSDPGLTLVTKHATIEDITHDRFGLLGRPIVDPKTGEQKTYIERLVHGEQVFVEVENVPVLYLPVVQGDANDPLGPLQSLGFRQDRVFGTQVLVTLNMFNILGIDPFPNSHWTLETDYLSRRGPGIGTDLDYSGKDLFDIPGKYSGLFRAYGLYDNAGDILGGGRGQGPYDDHPDFRGRVLARHVQDLPDGFQFQGQFSYLSDKNFLEQYYKTEFDTDINKETFLYLKQSLDNWQWSALLQPNMRDWVTETVSAPRVDGAVVGQSFFDLFTYNVRGNAGYYDLRPTKIPPPAYLTTDQRVDGGRFDVMQDISLPFYLGPVKVVPYGVLDTAYYTDALDNSGKERLVGGGGVRASIPFTRLYPEVQSEFFNLDGINHKIVFSGNYYYAHSDHPYTDFPQFDRLDEDSTDQALRDIRPVQATLNPAHGFLLATSPVYDPQLYAIRQLVDNRTDTLDTMEVLQADIRQRWQTKRGYPGMEHIVDYVTLDLSASFFPNPNRDDFGHSVSFVQYDATWNIGDRTQLVSSGLLDPFKEGEKAYSVGAFLNRPDRTSFYIGYSFVDPIDQRALTGAVTYVFSPKYAMTASATYDFGIQQSLSNSLILTRVGTDLTLNIGFTYNALLNNFGFTMEILPNLVAASRGPAASAFGVHP